MSQMKEIRLQIGSIKNTQKITHAMELVAASKMRKAQDRMTRSKPYAEKIRTVIHHLAASHPEYEHPYLKKRDKQKRLGFIVVSSDRGLCGGLNINLFRKLVAELKGYQDQDIEVDLCLIGRKAVNFFSKYSDNIVATQEHLGDAPDLSDLIGLVKAMLDNYDKGALDGLFLCYNEFVNTMTQKPCVQQLLPLQPDTTEAKTHWDYIYEPDSARDILDLLLKRYIESQVYQGAVENIAAFQAAQMVAMKAATDNAGELIKDLKKVYNKARQANITREISEIVSGAAAIE